MESTHLNTRFVEFRAAGQFLARINVRIVALVKGGLELVELLLRERGPVAASCGRRTPSAAATAARRAATVLTTVCMAHTATIVQSSVQMQAARRLGLRDGCGGRGSRCRHQSAR